MQQQPPPPPPPDWQSGYAPVPLPRGPAPGELYAGFWIRLGAYLIDALIVGIPVTAVLVALYVATSGPLRCTTVAIGLSQQVQCTGGTSALAQAAIYLLPLAASAAYFIPLWARGRSLGQRLLGLRVVDANSGGRITTGRAALRFLGFLVSVWVLYIGLIWAAFDPRKQGWHDKAATTFVVRRG